MSRVAQKQVVKAFLLSYLNKAWMASAHQSSQAFICEEYHAISVVIPKEGMAWLVPAKQSFGMTTPMSIGPVFTGNGSYQLIVSCVLVECVF